MKTPAHSIVGFKQRAVRVGSEVAVTVQVGCTQVTLRAVPSIWQGIAAAVQEAVHPSDKGPGRPAKSPVLKPGGSIL